MSDMAIKLHQKEDDFPLCEDSDEMLEVAACTRDEIAGNFTLGACTGLSICPG